MKRSAILLVAMCGSAAADPAAVELAGTLSGKTQDPETGVRAAVIKPVATSTTERHGNHASVSLGLLGRVDSHGAPAESGAMFETQAVSFGIGLRGALTATTPSVRFTSCLDVTAGRTTARGDSGVWDSAGHTLVTVGFLLGPAKSHVSGLFDAGWMVTKVGDGRIGPIVSLGLNVTL